MGCASAVRPGGASAWLLSGSRLHLQHGPIDLIIDAIGEPSEVTSAYRQATEAFSSVLDTLAAQLPLLRQPLDLHSRVFLFRGEVARRMFRAAEPCMRHEVTPMIAVAGSVADHVLAALRAGRSLKQAQVNNGGDIALYLGSQGRYRVGICASPASTDHPDVITLDAGCGVGGIATSGWQGRSHSLGIADAVTVLARHAAQADVAATLIANAVDLPASSRVQRLPACLLSPYSDLGERPVTVAVETLSAAEKAQALGAGLAFARQLLARGLITGACLKLQGESRVAGMHMVCNDLTQTGIERVGNERWVMEHE